jgi:hypothetical protein
MFKTEKFIPVSVADLGLVAQELADHFKQRSYQVERSPLPDGEWEVGITRGGVFKAILGLKSALKIQIGARPAGTMVRARVGIFGKQVVPTVITMLVAWPVVLTQVWGVIREAGLDDEAVRVVEIILTRTERAARVPAGRAPDPSGSPLPSSAPAGVGAEGARVEASNARSAGAFCASCGGQVDESARFCPICGHSQAS